MSEITDKKYNSEGWLIISELSYCPNFDNGKMGQASCLRDCFFCKFSDFRKREYIEQLETESRDGILFSVCHNEKNRKSVD